VDVGNAACPVTGTPVADNAFCLVGAELIRLSSPAAVAEVRKDPAKALRTAKEGHAPKAEPEKPEPKPKGGSGAGAK
jgi:hypothetical protein